VAPPADQSLDPRAVLASLGVTGATHLAAVSGGQDTAMWRVEHPGGVFALRVFRPEQRLTCEWEVAALRAAAAGGLPVPAIYALGRWHDRPVLLLSWCSGRPLASELAARPWRLWSLGVAFGRTHAAIHALPAPPLLREAPSWIERLGPIEAGDEATARLRATLAALSRDRAALLHLDYHPLNVLASEQGITAVLDWANARAGDPRADLARTYTLLRLAPWPPLTGARSFATAAGVAAGVLTGTRFVWEPILRRLLERAWRYGCQLASGSIYTPHELAPFYAWAGRWLEHELRIHWHVRPAGPSRLGGATQREQTSGYVAHHLPSSASGWIRPHHLLRIRRWTARWQQRAGSTT